MLLVKGCGWYVKFSVFWEAHEPSNWIGDYYFVFDAFNKLHMILVHKVKRKAYNISLCIRLQR